MTLKQVGMFMVMFLLMPMFSLVRADTPSLPPPPAQPVAVNMTGTIQSMDLTNNTVLIDDGNGNMRKATINKTANVYRDGATVSFSDLKIGDRVTVQLPNPASTPTAPPAE